MKNKLKYLTISLITLFIAVPFLEQGRISLIILNLLTSITFLFGIYFVSYSKKNIFIASVLGLPWFIISWVEIFTPAPLLALTCLSNLFLICFFSFTTIVILSFILKPSRITEDILYGAVSIYIFIGAIWFVIYTLLETLIPGSFYSVTEHRLGNPLKWSDFIYYSFTTLTTLGYGDIVPVTTLARSFALLESILGVMYLAIIISRLVGLYIADSLNSKSRQEALQRFKTLTH